MLQKQCKVTTKILFANIFIEKIVKIGVKICFITLFYSMNNERELVIVFISSVLCRMLCWLGLGRLYKNYKT